MDVLSRSARKPVTRSMTRRDNLRDPDDRPLPVLQPIRDDVPVSVSGPETTGVARPEPQPDTQQEIPRSIEGNVDSSEVVATLALHGVPPTQKSQAPSHSVAVSRSENPLELRPVVTSSITSLPVSQQVQGGAAVQDGTSGLAGNNPSEWRSSQASLGGLSPAVVPGEGNPNPNLAHTRSGSTTGLISQANQDLWNTGKPTSYTRSDPLLAAGRNAMGMRHQPPLSQGLDLGNWGTSAAGSRLMPEGPLVPSRFCRGGLQSVQDWADLSQGDQAVVASGGGGSRMPEPKLSLPLYNGKREWRVFWLQFSRLAQRMGWSMDRTLDQLIACLREDALEHYAQESLEVRGNLWLLVSSLERRFGDRTRPETYRATLLTLKKQTKETYAEYASRVRKLVSRAYPGITGSDLLEDMTIEYLLSGLPDTSLMYDVLSKRPASVEAALDLIQWHESCRSIQRRRTGIRQVSASAAEEAGDLSLRRVGGKSFITEDRLNQFGRELVQQLRSELPSGKRGTHQGAGKWKESVECYRCHKKGHFARECPEKQKTTAPTTEVGEEVEEPLN